MYFKSNQIHRLNAINFTLIVKGLVKFTFNLFSLFYKDHLLIILLAI